MIDRTTLHMGNPAVSSTEIYQIRYGMAMWLLQENGGLSYNEARVYLANSRNESNEQLAKALKVNKQTIYDLRRSAKEKLDGRLMDDIYMGYTPLIVEVSGPTKDPFF